MLKVLDKGMYSSIQDLGRYHFRTYGVPIAGAMDHYSAHMANLVLGNDQESAVLEVTYNGTFEFLRDTLLCISGADLGVTLNDRPIVNNHPIIVEKNSILKFNHPKYGLRSYVAVKGGFLNKPVLGSRSFYQMVTKKHVLSKNDEIFYEPYQSKAVNTFSHLKINSEHFESKDLQVYKGPDYELLSTKNKENLSAFVFTIGKDHSRMGYRLNEQIKNAIESQLTSAVMPGTVQLTPSGELIILMRDCGVTGGYPRVLQLTETAINRLAQKSTNDQIKFKIVDLPV